MAWSIITVVQLFGCKGVGV